MCCWGLIARQDIPHPSTKPSLFGAVWNTVLLKSAGRCRLVIQLTQWCRATSVTVIFVFLFFFFLSCCLQQVEGDVSFLIWNAAADNRTAVKESFLQRPCFCSSCMWPEKVSRLLDSGFHLCLALSYGIPYHVLHHCSL